MADVDRLKEDIVFSVRLRGQEMTFHSTWGLFSPRRVDDGSFLLLKHIKVNEDDLTLDLGCGYGVLGLTIARLTPRGQVHLVDKDFVAVEYAEKNARVNGLANCQAYLSNAFREVPDVHAKLPVGEEAHDVSVKYLREHHAVHFPLPFFNFITKDGPSTVSL